MVSYMEIYGEKVTNLSYLDSLELFNEAHETDNPCSILAPGYGSSDMCVNA